MSTSLSNTLTVGPGTCECVYAYHSGEGCEGGGYKTTEKKKKRGIRVWVNAWISLIKWGANATPANIRLIVARSARRPPT